jgi:flagellar biosynthesis/type III secretory pathway protein FliH
MRKRVKVSKQTKAALTTGIVTSAIGAILVLKEKRKNAVVLNQYEELAENLVTLDQQVKEMETIRNHMERDSINAKAEQKKNLETLEEELRKSKEAATKEYEAGFNDGNSEGFQKGYEKGYGEGKKAGMKEGKKSTYVDKDNQHADGKDQQKPQSNKRRKEKGLAEQSVDTEM